MFERKAKCYDTKAKQQFKWNWTGILQINWSYLMTYLKLVQLYDIKGRKRQSVMQLHRIENLFDYENWNESDIGFLSISLSFFSFFFVSPSRFFFPLSFYLSHYFTFLFHRLLLSFPSIFHYLSFSSWSFSIYLFLLVVLHLCSILFFILRLIFHVLANFQKSNSLTFLLLNVNIFF